MLATMTIVHVVMLVTWTISHVWITSDGTSMIAHIFRWCCNFRHILRCLECTKQSGLWNKWRYFVPQTTQCFTYTGFNLLQETKTNIVFTILSGHIVFGNYTQQYEILGIEIKFLLSLSISFWRPIFGIGLELQSL